MRGTENVIQKNKISIKWRKIGLKIYCNGLRCSIHRDGLLGVEVELAVCNHNDEICSVENRYRDGGTPRVEEYVLIRTVLYQVDVRYLS